MAQKGQTVKQGQPYSLAVRHNINGANNMTFQKDIGERCDDCLDANAVPRWKVGQVGEDYHLVNWNTGENLNQLSKLLGLSDVISRKPETKIGLMNRGSFASLCNLQPNLIYLLSKNEKHEVVELEFRFGEYVAAIRALQDANYCDEKLSPQDFIKANCITRKGEAHFKSVFNTVGDAFLKKELDSMLVDGPASSGLLIDLVFKPGHRLNGIDAELMKALLDLEVSRALPILNLFHGQLLTGKGASITFEDSMKKLVVLDKKSAVDLLAGNEHVLGCIEVGTREEGGETKETVFRVNVSLPSKPAEGTRTFFITNAPTDKRYKGSQVMDAYPKWSKLKGRGQFKCRLTCLNKEEDDKQKEDLSLNQGEMLRGVFIGWNGRYLGPPYWAKRWGDRCNAGPIRIDMNIESSHYIIEKIFRVQTDKGAINLDEADPVLVRLLDCFVDNVEKQMISSGTKRQRPDWEAIKNDKKWKPTWTADVFEVIHRNKLPDSPLATPSAPSAPLVPVATPVAKRSVPAAPLAPSAPLVPAVPSVPSAIPTNLPPAAPIPRPALQTKVEFGEDEGKKNLLITYNKVLMGTIPFVGQFAKARDHFEQIRNHQGDARFKAILPTLIKAYEFLN